MPKRSLTPEDGEELEKVFLDLVVDETPKRVIGRPFQPGQSGNPSGKAQEADGLDDNLKLVAEQAEAAGAQVWMEYVTASADGVAVMLEDGHEQ